jgi:hypothetical protein
MKLKKFMVSKCMWWKLGKIPNFCSGIHEELMHGKINVHGCAH